MTTDFAPFAYASDTNELAPASTPLDTISSAQIDPSNSRATAGSENRDLAFPPGGNPVAAPRTNSRIAGITSAELLRNERIEQYLPLVDSVLGSFRRKLPAHIDLDDLHSAGVTGLISAAERFDPEQGNTFKSYVCLRIRGAILDELRRLDPCSRASRARSRKIQGAVQEAEQRFGRAPTDAEVSAQLNISVAEFIRWRETSASIRLISLDGQSENSDSKGGSLHDLLSADGPDVRETMEKQELVSLVTDRIAMLPDTQKRVLALYYFERMHFSEIAVAFGLTESRICQIHKQAVATLRAFVESSRRN
ncbi:MAG: FliA/WhiG family RNA polymerase sigma factor [Opitutaceae bacterium]